MNLEAKKNDSPERTSFAREFVSSCADCYSKMICIASAIAGESELAYDIVQQAYTIAIEKNPVLDDPQQFQAWLSRVVRNCALNQVRKRSRRKTFATDPVNLNIAKSTDLSNQPIDPTTGELVVDQSDFDDQVTTALHSLSYEARCCLLLRTVEDLSYREIANLMDMPEGTAMNHVHRSKQKMRERLAPKYEEGGER